MKKLNSERFYLNRAGKDAPQTVRLTLCMKDAVDGLILSEAVADTQKRYPYLCVRLSTYKDEHGCEHAAFEDNPLPWVLSNRREPLLLMDSEANFHLLSFACWDDCIALDFFHAVMDGEAAYRVLRTLLYEYCRRRYDSSLSAEGVWTADSHVDEEEWTDPATMPRPESQTQQKATEFPKALNISENPIAPITDRHEVVHIVASEEQMMAKIHASKGTPVVWLSLLLNKVVARLHPAANDAVPTVVVTVNLRKALGTPLSHHSLVGGLSLQYTKEVQALDIAGQMAEMRRMVARQTTPDKLQAYFWQTTDRMDILEQLPTLEARYQAMSQATSISHQYASTVLSYVGKANMGAAEQYVRELRTDTYTPYLISLQVAAIGGKFCLSFRQQFASDVYLDAFLAELRQQGISYNITGRHLMEIASIADFRQTTE